MGRMDSIRLYVKLRLGVVLGLGVACGGCWETIEYKGSPATVAAAKQNQQANAAEPAPPATSKDGSEPAGSATTAGPAVVEDGIPPLPTQPPTDKREHPRAPREVAKAEDIFPPSPPATPNTEDDRYALPHASTRKPDTATDVANGTSEPGLAATTRAGTEPLETTIPDKQPIDHAAPPPTPVPPPETSKAEASPDTALSTQRAAWLMGSRLSLAALASDRGIAVENIPVWMSDARTLSRFLGVEVPDLPQPPDREEEAAAGRRGQASSRVINYLLMNGQQIGRELTQRHGVQQAALFEIALKSNFLLLLYSPGSSDGSSIAGAIRRAAGQAELPERLWRPLFDAIDHQRPEGEVRAAVRIMHLDVDRYLSGGAGQDSR